MATCTNHPAVEASQFCVGCGRPFCNDCLVDLQGAKYCAACKNTRVRDLQRVEAYKLPGEALTYSIVGLFCCGIILEPIALSKALQALKEIDGNPSLPGKEKAVAAKWISIVGLVLWALGTLARVINMASGGGR